MTQSVKELQERVTAINAIFSSLLSPTGLGNLSSDQKAQLVTGINKAYGQAMGFKHEYVTTVRQLEKGRKVETQVYADVTSGRTDDAFAKSVELKSITAPDKGSVKASIEKAIKQLAGLTGHTPRDNDVRIVDVRIDGFNNPWPFSGGSYGITRSAQSKADFKSTAVSELRSILQDGSAGSRTLLNWLDGQDLSDFNQFSPLRNHTQTFNGPTIFDPSTTVSFPNSTRPLYKTNSGGINFLRCVTFKIRYEKGYLLSDYVGIFQEELLDEIVIQAFKRPDGLRIQCVKIKSTHIKLNLFTFFQEEQQNRQYFDY